MGEHGPGLVYWAGVGFLDAVPELLRQSVGANLTIESVKTLLTYRSLNTQDELELDSLTVVLAAPCQPQELAALGQLKEAGLLALTVLLERGGPGGWGVFGKKPTSLTANYLSELDYDESGWLEWESQEKSLTKLTGLLEDAKAEPNGLVVVYCGDEGEPSFEGEMALAPSHRASQYVRHVFSEASGTNTVYSRFSEFLKTEVMRKDVFSVRAGELENPSSLRRRFSMFRQLAEESDGSPVLLLPSLSLPLLYSELRTWCDAPSGRQLTLVVHSSGLPPKGQECVGGLTDGNLLLSIPHLVVAVPADENQAQSLFQEAQQTRHPYAIVFSSAPAVGFPSQSSGGSSGGRMLRAGKDASILAMGSTVYPALLAAESLQPLGLDVGVYDVRYRRPMDKELFKQARDGVRLVVAVDEHPDAGGFAGQLWKAEDGGPGLLRLGIEVEDVELVLAAAPGEMLTLEHFGLHAEGIAKSIKSSMRLAPPSAFG